MNDELGLFERKGNVLVSSRIISGRFGKRHNDVVAAIDSKIKNLTTEKFVVKNYFIESKFSHNGNLYKEYLLTRDGFCFIVMSFTGKEADLWKLKYIEAFNRMEALVRERQTTEWLQTREKGKLIRREETDAIQLLIPYAEEQGSTSMEKRAYVIYTQMVNKAVGLESGQREAAPYKTLMLVALMEDIVSNTILEEMDKGTYYKNIYKKCKEKIESFVSLAYLNVA